MIEPVDPHVVPSVLLERAWSLGQLNGIGIGLIVGVTGSLIAYPAWMVFVDWVREVGLLPW